MTRFSSFLPIFLVAGMFGCNGPGLIGRGAEISIVGVGALSPVTGEIVFGDPRLVGIDGEPLPGLDIEPEDVIETAVAVHLRVEQQLGPLVYDYEAVLGAAFEPQSVGRGAVHNSAPTLDVKDGWVSAWGTNALLRHQDWIDGGNVGRPAALIIVQVVSADSVRVFSPATNGPLGDVWYTCAGGTQETVPVGEYHEVDRTCTVTAAGLIGAAPPEVQAFEEKARAVATEAGWPGP